LNPSPLMLLREPRAVTPPYDLNDQLSCLLQDVPHAAELIQFVRRGKHVRAALTMAATRAARGLDAAATTAAASLECLHSAALIQDDIIDGAATRRGTKAMHVLLGMDNALMLADCLIGRCVMMLADATTRLPVGGQLAALREIGACISACARGQLLELAAVDRGDERSEAIYFKTVQAKTGAQFSAAATLGPLLSDASQEYVRALRAFGLAIGSAFQLRDDMLDLLGDSGVMGKPVRNSLARGRILLPLVYLARYGSTKARAAMVRFRADADNWEAVKECLDTEGIWPRVTATAQRYVDEAVAALRALPESDALEELRTIAAMTISRTS
jgi:octaprenyl-diphosphate synthase